MDNNLDKDALNLAKAIRRTETGGSKDPYNQKGKSGEFGGYQFTPATYKALAKQHLGDANADPTVENQNRIAYKEIKRLKDAGHTPAEIASYWNSGKTDAYKKGLKGINKYGVKYDVPGYVKKVSAAYNELSKPQIQQIVSPQPTEQAPQIKGGFLGRFLTGNTQQFAQTSGQALAAPENAQRYTQALEQHTTIQRDLLKAIKNKKALGQDTSRLEDALSNHIETTPKLQDFTGNVINKTAGQIVGEAGGTALEALSGGLLTKGGRVLQESSSVLGKIKKGAKIGATYGGAGGMFGTMAEGGNLKDTIKEGIVGAGAGAVLGGGLEFAGSKITKKIATKAAEKNVSKKLLAGQIVQGLEKDQGVAQKVLSELDSKKIKNYRDLTSSLENNINQLEKRKNAILITKSAESGRVKLNKLKFTINSEGKKVYHNYIKDGLDQLEKYFIKTNDISNLSKIKQLRIRAIKLGLTPLEIDKLARLHGSTLKSFNLNGELASGLTKQAAENTRAGIKSTVRALSKDTRLAQIDKQISENIKVSSLSKKIEEQINKLKQKTIKKEVSLGNRAGQLIGKVVNMATLGSAKGFARSLIFRPSSTTKIGVLELERTLQKKLQLLQKATNSKSSQGVVIKSLEALIKDFEPKSVFGRVEKPKVESKIFQDIKPRSNFGVKKSIVPTKNIPKIVKDPSVPKGVNIMDIGAEINGVEYWTPKKKTELKNILNRRNLNVEKMEFVPKSKSPSGEATWKIKYKTAGSNSAIYQIAVDTEQQAIAANQGGVGKLHGPQNTNPDWGGKYNGDYLQAKDLIKSKTNFGSNKKLIDFLGQRLDTTRKTQDQIIKEAVKKFNASESRIVKLLDKLTE